MKISKLLNGVAATALSSALALCQMGVALADDAGVQQQQGSAPQQAVSAYDMTKIASDYSMENGGRVGIFINIAPDTRFTSEQIGNAMVAKFAGEGIEAAYISNQARAGTTTVTYYMNGTVWAGYDLGAAPQAFTEVVRSYRAMKGAEQKPADELVADALVLNQ